MEITPEIQQKLKLLEEKYSALGQDLSSYLDGLLHADVTTYWDYIELDTLLSLQKPKTQFPDEQVFIMYHQITELYFKLALNEFEQLGAQVKIDKDFFLSRVGRINRYFEALIQSFEIMVDGMDRDQFLKFRMSLLPASGFQSVQYRKIEIFSSDFINLVAKDKRAKHNASSTITEMFESIYWKDGATELESGKKTLTLTQFEERYKLELLALSEQCRTTNLWQVYLRLSKNDQNNPEVKVALRKIDANININWRLAHYKSAVRYLARSEKDIPATGGTNWQKYLPPRLQRRIFYTQLWSNEEIEIWGKAWVDEALKSI
jgi:tryptophan 2,3-dioxygenase